MYTHAVYSLSVDTGNGFDLRIPVIAQILGDPALSARVKAKALGDFSVAAFRLLERNGGKVAA